MTRLTASNLAREIAALNTSVEYNYVSEQNPGRIRIVRVDQPEGPVVFKRYNPSEGGSYSSARNQSISTSMLWRIANSIRNGVPINFDRVLGASYNSRSVLEALLAHTPRFHVCRPGRLETTGSRSTVQDGHKHLLWREESPHELGVMNEIEVNIVISEVPTAEAIYEGVVLPETAAAGLDINVARRHAQMQIALVEIGRQLEFQTWVALGDRRIEYNGQRLGEIDGVVSRLGDLPQVNAFPEAVRAGEYIDVVWFKNGRLMPAVMEIEHSTGVTSGLTRMRGFIDRLPPIRTRCVIVAADEDRERVVEQANRDQFRSLDTRYFSYSAVEELYSLCQRRRIRGISEEFLDCFMERVVS